MLRYPEWVLKPRTPPDELQRLRALQDLKLLDTPPEERFDRITRLAAMIFDVPVALISLVDADRQWFKSRHGITVRETPRDVSFCGHAILADPVFVVPDAARDERFKDNPLVTGETSVRFYAGIPLKTVDGSRVGTLCVIDHRPRRFDRRERETLADLAALVQEEISITRLREAAALLADREEQLNDLFENASDLIQILAPDGTFLFVNRAWRETLGYPGDLKGLHFLDVVDAAWKDHCAAALRRALRGEVPDLDIVLRTHHGSQVFVSGNINCKMQNGLPVAARSIFRNITDRRQMEEEIRRRAAVQRAILDSANVTIISTDPQGVIQTFNRAAETKLGYRSDEVVGKVTPELIHDHAEIERRAGELSVKLGRNIEPGFEAFVARARLGPADEQEWTYVRKDGTRFPVLLSVTALRDRAGAITGFLGVGIDITERKQVERMKNEFISLVSHELRTPLTSIRGALGLVAGGVLGEIPGEARSMIDIATEDTERLVRLINGILDVEKIEAGKTDFRTENLDLIALVKQSIEINRPFAMQSQVVVEFQSDLDEARVIMDSDRIIQVMTNLLSNAIKFSPRNGTILVSVSRHDGAFRVSVKDQGPGIPLEFRSRVFQKFAQADASASRQGGSGLGLSISRAIVEKHGGRIGFESQPGAGATFYFDLPGAP